MPPAIISSCDGSVLKLCGYKAIYDGFTPNRAPLLTYSSNSAQCRLLRIQKNHSLISRCSFLSREQLTRKLCVRDFHNQNKSSRCIVVRSELAESSSRGSAFSLPEIKIGSKIRGICFYAVGGVTAIFLFVLMLIAHPFVLLLDRYKRKAHYMVAKTWATLCVRLFFNIEFEGLENLPLPDTPTVYVSNHQSFLDIYTLLTLGSSFKFISKMSIFAIPIIGWAMFLMGVIPLKRMDSRSHLECLKQCTDLIKKGASVFFFPEGTRSKDGKLGTFKKGAFSVAAKTGVPIVPITIMGTGKIMPAGMESILNQGSVKVVIHKPIQGNNAEALSNEARSIISDALNCHC